MDKKKEGRVTGLGGVFFKSEDPAKLKQWYQNHLNLDCDKYGHLFEWRWSENPEKIGYTQWSVFEKDTEYMLPGKKDFMINFRVQNIVLLVDDLNKNGMQVIGTIEEYEYGKFAWVMDPEGNKIELWEPIDEVFTKMKEESNDRINRLVLVRLLIFLKIFPARVQDSDQSIF